MASKVAQASPVPRRGAGGRDGLLGSNLPEDARGAVSGTGFYRGCATMDSMAVATKSVHATFCRRAGKICDSQEGSSVPELSYPHQCVYDFARCFAQD